MVISKLSDVTNSMYLFAVIFTFLFNALGEAWYSRTWAFVYSFNSLTILGFVYFEIILNN